MRHRALGQSGIEASVIGLGTWAIGGWMWGGTEEAQSLRAIQEAIDCGINFIDTAPAYGLGLAEEFTGKAIRGRRDRVVLATKCGLVWHTQRGNHFFDQGGKPVHRHLGADSIKYEIEQSLRRLGTDYVDLYQTHWQDPTTPIAETMGALMDLKREGKIRAIGVSNAKAADIVEYERTGLVDSDQEKYNMLQREPEAELLPYVRGRGIAFLAYSPLALGLLTGKIGPDRKFAGDDLRASNPRFSPENLRKVRALLEEIRPVADARGLTLAQLALAWTVARPGVTHALAGARHPQQARENAAAGNAELSGEEAATIDAAIGRMA